MLVHDIKERPLLHLFEGGKFAAKKIKVTVDKRGEGKEEEFSETQKKLFRAIARLENSENN